MEQPDDEIPPGYEELRSALRAPVAVDAGVRSRHLEVALASSPNRRAVTRRPRRLTQVLAAAAVVAVAGVVGTWTLTRPADRSSSSESVASGGGSNDTRPAERSQGAADETTGSAPDMPTPEMADRGTASGVADKALAQLIELGAFDDVVSLRAAAKGPLDHLRSPVSSTSTAGFDAVEPTAPDTNAVSCNPPEGTSWAATATVAGAPVLLGLDLTGNVIVVDRDTCAIR